MKERAQSSDRFGVGITSRPALSASASARGDWTLTCRDRDGNIRWEEDWRNIVVNAGLDYLLDAGLSGGTPVTSWYLGLISGSEPTIAAGNTMASHAGWTEFEDYEEATRVAWTDGGVSGQAVNNSGSPAVFTIDDAGTVGGAFLTSGSAKGGTTGTLYAAGAFGTARAVIAGDTLTVTATFTQAAA